MKHHRNPYIKVPIISLPADISIHHKDIKIRIDLFYINRLHFLHTKSFNITFLTEEISISRSTDKIIQELHTVANMNKSRGFNISVYHRDNEFDINDLR